MASPRWKETPLLQTTGVASAHVQPLVREAARLSEGDTVDKPRVRFLTVIWGERYIEEFARVSLPSYMAPGNLPALAAETDLEVVVLTSSASVPQFSKEPIFDRLRTLCPIRFIVIDDLITTGVYGVTLTLAYARGIIDTGAEQTNTTFVFMNADFVLADGSLRTLAGRIKAGERCIMAPSLRAVSGPTVPQLEAAVDQSSQTLSMPPRRMVRLTFDNLHPTVIGKTVTQKLMTCETHNQIYWQVDDNTLLARYHLIFMLAIKPEKPLGLINSYCDYGFVPEMVPSGAFSILDDSDEFFMLELQPAAQERSLLRSGSVSAANVASSLAKWTTAEHRRFATVDVVFKSADPSPQLVDAKREAAQYLDRVQSLMPNPPVTHVDHFYWVMGLQSWATLKFAAASDPPVYPPEITAGTQSLLDGCRGYDTAVLPAAQKKPSMPLSKRIEASILTAYIGAINKVRVSIGAMPNVPIWHHLWLDSRLILQWIETVPRGPGTRHLLICDENNPLATTLPKFLPFDVCVNPDKFDVFIEGIAPGSRYDHILVLVRRTQIRNTRRIIEAAQNYLKSDGAIGIFVWHENAEIDPSNFSYELAAYSDEILPPSWLGYQIDCHFAGGGTKRRLRLIERWLFRYMIPTSHLRLPLLIAACMLWSAVAALTGINNFVARKKSGDCPQFCSSALISLRRARSALAPAATI